MESGNGKCLNHEKRISAVEESVKSAHKRIDELFCLTKIVKDLTISVGIIKKDLTQIKKAQNV